MAARDERRAARKAMREAELRHDLMGERKAPVAKGGAVGQQLAVSSLVCF